MVLITEDMRLKIASVAEFWKDLLYFNRICIEKFSDCEPKNIKVSLDKDKDEIDCGYFPIQTKFISKQINIFTLEDNHYKGFWNQLCVDIKVNHSEIIVGIYFDYDFDMDEVKTSFSITIDDSRSKNHGLSSYKFFKEFLEDFYEKNRNPPTMEFRINIDTLNIKDDLSKKINRSLLEKLLFPDGSDEASDMIMSIFYKKRMPIKRSLCI